MRKIKQVLSWRWVKSFEAQKELRVDSCELMHLRLAGELGFKKEGNAYLYARHEVNRVKLRRAKPPKATPKPYTRHILGIDSGVQSHPKATSKPTDSQPIGTPKPPQSHPKATPRLPQGYPKATPMRPQSHPEVKAEG